MIGAAELSDETVRAAAEGSPTERAHLMTVVEPQVRLMVLARLSTTPARFHAVEEVAQQVLLGLTAGLQRLENQTVNGLNAFVSGIVIRQVALSIKEGIARKGPGMASLDSTASGLSRTGPLWQFLSASGMSPRTVVERAEQLNRLMIELGQLKPAYRDVITLAFFDQLPMDDIARRMDISRAAASMLLLRAVRTLRRNMTGSSQTGASDEPCET
jgi:RNA polymerase sigma factor (sigma-70 family)